MLWWINEKFSIYKFLNLGDKLAVTNNICTSCEYPFILKDTKCICRDGEFQNQITKKCENCH